MQPEVHGTRSVEKDLSNFGIDDQFDHDGVSHSGSASIMSIRYPGPPFTIVCLA